MQLPHLAAFDYFWGDKTALAADLQPAWGFLLFFENESNLRGSINNL